jgi:hypothetical protein
MARLYIWVIEFILGHIKLIFLTLVILMNHFHSLQIFYAYMQ